MTDWTPSFQFNKFNCKKSRLDQKFSANGFAQWPNKAVQLHFYWINDAAWLLVGDNWTECLTLDERRCTWSKFSIVLKVKK